MNTTLQYVKDESLVRQPLIRTNTTCGRKVTNANGQPNAGHRARALDVELTKIVAVHAFDCGHPHGLSLTYAFPADDSFWGNGSSH